MRPAKRNSDEVIR